MSRRFVTCSYQILRHQQRKGVDGLRTSLVWQVLDILHQSLPKRSSLANNQANVKVLHCPTDNLGSASSLLVHQHRETCVGAKNGVNLATVEGLWEASTLCRNDIRALGHQKRGHVDCRGKETTRVAAQIKDETLTSKRRHEINTQESSSHSSP